MILKTIICPFLEKKNIVFDMIQTKFVDGYGLLTSVAMNVMKSNRTCISQFRCIVHNTAVWSNRHKPFL